tara:strand:- start:5499 stop:5708 length:210 start_codon:yes stop_codon:yes gene_type:complete
MPESTEADKAQYRRTKLGITVHPTEVLQETRQLRRAKERMVKKVLREETKKVMRRKMIKGGPAAFADPV